MRKVVFLVLVVLTSYQNYSQQLVTDSLQGFDLPETVLQARQFNMEGSELKTFVNIARRDYLIKKYNLVISEQRTSKYSSNTSQSLPCVNEDFELFPTGPITSAFGWSAQQNSGYISLCSSTVMPMLNNTNAVVVYSTPVVDPICGTIGTSPFGGNNIVKINSTGNQVAKIRTSFPVISTNWFYNYAYQGVLAQEIHGCCLDPFLTFRFYTAQGNLISSLSHTVVMGTPSCVTTSTANWAASTASLGGSGVNFTPNWQIFGCDLSAYTGSVLTVEVEASACYSGGHPGYMYYDALCSVGSVVANGTGFILPGATYTSCASTASLSALPGYSNCIWQGPPASGVSGFTTSAITTSVAGSYTLTYSSATTTFSQTFNLVMSPQMSISGNSLICTGNTGTLQVTGTGLTSFNWSTASTLQSISVTPTTTSTYSLITTNSYGCTFTASASIAVLTMSLIANTTTLCAGQNANLSTIAPGVPSYTWNTGAVNSGITVSPSVTTVYTVVGTAPTGCQISDSKTITVYPSPPFQVSLSSPSLCLGQSATLSASGTFGNSYYWSTGLLTFSIAVSPTITSVYTTTATGAYGCTGSVSNTITVYTLPQIQIIATNTEICAGETANFGLLGSNISTVLWNTGSNSLSFTVSPLINSVYSVTVSSSAGCISNKSASLIVNPLPQVNIVASSHSICVGESVTLFATGSGITNFQWSTNQNSSSIVVSPTATTIYSVSVSDAKGCSSDTTFQLEVLVCAGADVGLLENKRNQKRLVIFPNPSGGSLEIKGYETEKGWLLNDLGQYISEFYLRADNNYTFKFTNLAKGIYFVTSNKGSEKIIVK